MEKKGYADDQSIVNLVGHCDFSFTTVQTYIYQYKKEKTGMKNKFTYVAIPEPRFKIGTKFIRRGRKYKAEETIIDYIVSYNQKGEIVGTLYQTSQDYMGQEVINYETPEATIARSEIII